MFIHNIEHLWDGTLKLEYAFHPDRQVVAQCPIDLNWSEIDLSWSEMDIA